MEKCVFIGYPPGYKGWKFYNPVTKRVIISERAEFDERYFPFKKDMMGPPSFSLAPLPQRPDLGGSSGDSSSEYFDASLDFDDSQSQPHQHALPPAIDPAPSPDPDPNIRPPTPPLALRREPRERRPPGEWWKVNRPASVQDAPSDDDELNIQDQNLESADLAIGAEPRTYSQALNCPDSTKWDKAIHEEYNMHLENGTWELVKLPPGRKAIGSGWVFKVKHNADGSIERYKARIVAKGYSQRPGLDYVEVFAPTSRAAAIRLIIAIAAIEDLHLHSVDISHAFINGKLDEEIYMEQPQGFVQPGYVCKLLRSLYGLKQASRVWNKELHAALSEMGFTRLQSDHGIYVYKRDDVRIIVPVHVDDLTFASKSQQAIDTCIKELSQHFELRDLGPTKLLLGIEVIRDRPKHSISLSQRQYIIDMLDRFNMSDSHPVSTPMDPGLRLDKSQGASSPDDMAYMESVPYLSAVGALMYLAVTTRPDIAYAVGVLARFSANPGVVHWKAVKHLFRYVKGTVDLKLTYSPDQSDEFFTSFTDADHGGCKDSGRSTGGYLVKVGTGAVSWRSKLQPTVALSTTEAEYIAAVEAGKEIIWMRNILKELGYNFSSPSSLRMDNQSGINVAKNPEHHGRMKHLDLRHHWLRDTVESGLIKPLYIPTAEMPADVLTKALPRQKMETCRGMMGLG
jgi:hypothetical protein